MADKKQPRGRKPLSKAQIQAKLDVFYDGHVKLLEHVTVNEKALFRCSEGHLFEARLKYLLYYDDRAKEPCTHCYLTNKRRKELTDLHMLDALIKTVDMELDNKSPQVDVLIKHIAKLRHSNNLEAVGTAVITLQKLLKNKKKEVIQ